MTPPTNAEPPLLIGCPFCTKGRYSLEYLPRHITLNHPDEALEQQLDAIAESERRALREGPL